MIEFIKSLGRPKPAPQYRDGLFGVLTRDNVGVWGGEMPYRTYHVRILLPGGASQPNLTRLALARALVADMESKVNSALDYAAERNPKLWRGKLSFSALNLSLESTGDRFVLDFVAVGDRSGSRWHVGFEWGKPTNLEYN